MDTMTTASTDRGSTTLCAWGGGEIAEKGVGNRCPMKRVTHIDGLFQQRLLRRAGSAWDAEETQETTVKDLTAAEKPSNSMIVFDGMSGFQCLFQQAQCGTQLFDPC